METVLIQKGRYDKDEIRPLVFEMLESLGRGLFSPGMRVLVKPNLLMAAGPEEGIVTHPLVVKAVVSYLLAREVRVQLSDSPAVGPFARVLRRTGYAAALEDLDVEVRPFEKTRSVDVGPPFGRIEVAADAVDADAVVNLAKVKTHTQMLLTLGVKNLFGCVVGLAKPQWHLRCGIDRDQFARLLVAVYRTVAPCLTLVDGIIALEGQGPGRGGTPRPLGIVAAGRSAPAVDAVLCRLLGLDPTQLATHRAAEEGGLLPPEIRVRGDFHVVDDFVLPRMAPATFGPPAISRLMRRHVLQKPVVDTVRCRQCGQCGKYCPAGAIAEAPRGVRFDYERCIRCYCCVEICPNGALQAVEPLAGRLMHRLSNLRARRD